MKNCFFLDGKKIEMSEETAKSLRKEVIPEPKPFIGGDILLGLVEDGIGLTWKVAIEVGICTTYNKYKVKGCNLPGQHLVVPLYKQEMIEMRDKLTELIEYLENN